MLCYQTFGQKLHATNDLTNFYFLSTHIYLLFLPLSPSIL
jgi:hypothetical protein